MDRTLPDDLSQERWETIIQALYLKLRQYENQKSPKGYHTFPFRWTELDEDCPCDNCELREKCGKENLSCQQYYNYSRALSPKDRFKNPGKDPSFMWHKKIFRCEESTR